jgi:hypothetical protein
MKLTIITIELTSKNRVNVNKRDDGELVLNCFANNPILKDIEELTKEANNIRKLFA